MPTGKQYCADAQEVTRTHKTYQVDTLLPEKYDTPQVAYRKIRLESAYA